MFIEQDTLPHSVMENCLLVPGKDYVIYFAHDTDGLGTGMTMVAQASISLPLTSNHDCRAKFIPLNFFNPGQWKNFQEQ
jgi:hypothetical protein